MTPDDDERIDEPQSTVLRIVSKGMSDAAAESTKQYGQELFKALLPAMLAAPLAGPMAAGAAAMVSTLIGTLFKETSATDRKLSKLLQEPFKTATRTIKRVMSEDVRDDAEEAYAARRLQFAADELERAYTFAEDEAPKKRLLVQVYQSLVAAFLEGGGAAMRKDLEEFRALVLVARERATRCIAEAERVRNRGDGVVAEELELWGKISTINQGGMVRRREGPFPLGLPSEEQLQSFLASREAGHRRRAADFEQWAEDMAAFCKLAEFVHQHRHEILRASKHKPLLATLRQRLSFGR